MRRVYSLDPVIGEARTVACAMAPLPDVGEEVPIIRVDDQKRFMGRVTSVNQDDSQYMVQIIDEVAGEEQPI